MARGHTQQEPEQKTKFRVLRLPRALTLDSGALTPVPTLNQGGGTSEFVSGREASRCGRRTRTLTKKKRSPKSRLALKRTGDLKRVAAHGTGDRFTVSCDKNVSTYLSNESQAPGREWVGRHNQYVPFRERMTVLTK